MPVYPRWRGEHIRCGRKRRRARGLSPLARGTPCAHFRKRKGRRFIPAGAGNTCVKPSRSPGVTVYPRWRGEHHIKHALACGFFGLSPLARGTPGKHKQAHARRRFIPAGAGNTINLDTGVIPAAVYPRWRGEHGTERKEKRKPAGLSPLARGTLLNRVTELVWRRFIPAGAGNT